MTWSHDLAAAPKDQTIDIWGQYDADTKPRRYTGCKWRTDFKHPAGAWMSYRGWRSRGDGWGEYVWDAVGVPLAWMPIPPPPTPKAPEPAERS